MAEAKLRFMRFGAQSVAIGLIRVVGAAGVVGLGCMGALGQVGTGWVARYNGVENSDDVAKGVGVDSAGNVYVTGRSGYWISQDSGGDYVTVKYDRGGHSMWVARYNGPGNNEDGGKALAVDRAGAVYVAGYSYGLYGYDFVTCKYVPAPEVQTRLDLARAGSDGTFNCRLSGELGWFYQVETSSNLVDWAGWTNVVLTTGPVEVQDARSEGGRFYRAVKGFPTAN